MRQLKFLFYIWRFPFITYYYIMKIITKISSRSVALGRQVYKQHLLCGLSRTATNVTFHTYWLEFDRCGKAIFLTISYSTSCNWQVP